MEALWFLAAFALGMSNSAQGGINSALGKRIGAWEGTFWNCFTGALAVGIVILTGFGGGDITRIVELPAYMVFLSGAMGMVSVICTMTASPRLGIAACFLWRMVGQFSAAILVDTYGLFGTSIKVVVVERIIGVLLMLLGSLIMYYKLIFKKQKINEQNNKTVVIFTLLSILGGACQAFLSAINASLTPVIGVFQTSFCVFMVTAILAFIIRFIWPSKGDYKNLLTAPKWVLIGGVIGVANNVLQSLTAVALGITLTTLYRNLGNVIFALVADGNGWFELPKMKISKERVIGILVMFAGIVVVNYKAILSLF